MTFSVADNDVIWVKNYLLFVPSLVILCKHVVPCHRMEWILLNQMCLPHILPLLTVHTTTDFAENKERIHNDAARFTTLFLVHKKN
jgi:hypothetical protein